MPKKISQEEAEEIVHKKCKDKNYTCSEFVYIGAIKTYLPLKCHCGHEWNSTCYSSFIQGTGCPMCTGNAKITQEEAELLVQVKCKEKNYTCSSFEYVGNTKTYLPLKCHCGHEWNSTRYGNFVHTNHGCPMCAGNIKLTQEEAEIRVQEKCKEKNYTYSEFEYIGNLKTYLQLRCHCGHEWNTTNYFNFINNNIGCPVCAGNIKLTQEEAEIRVQEKCNETNYTCSSFEYIGNQKTYLSLTCNLGHKWNTTSYADFLRGRRCPKCNICKNSKNRTITQEEATFRVKEKCNETNYTCSSFEYIGNKTTYLPLRCDNGHSWNTTSYNKFLAGRGCPKCAGKNQKFAYIHVVMDSETPVALKYGIESTKGTRHKKQNKNSIFEVQEYLSYEFNTVDDCKKAELECKQTLGNGILTKREMFDGHTETTGTENLNTIIEIYERHGGVKTS